MNKIITYDTLRNFTYSNDKLCTQPIRGIIISFFGLGGADMYNDDIDQGISLAKQGIIFLIPYNNPWAWMNAQAIAYTDEIVDVLVSKYDLADDIPIASIGGSMGGQSALVYTCYSKRTPAVCVANCPVCDMVYHYTERPDLPRTMYSAFCNEEGDINDVLARFSPLHLADKMPKTEYHVFHCTDDKSVNKAGHSDKFVRKMQDNDHDITYDIVPDKGHCDLTPEMWELYMNYAVRAVLRDKK